MKHTQGGVVCRLWRWFRETPPLLATGVRYIGEFGSNPVFGPTSETLDAGAGSQKVGRGETLEAVKSERPVAYKPRGSVCQEYS